MSWLTMELASGDEVQYLREARRSELERTSYVVSMPQGLLVGRVYSRRGHWNRDRRWFAEGWTPATESCRFGGFATRLEAFSALVDVEVHGRWPHKLLVHSRQAQEMAA